MNIFMQKALSHVKLYLFLRLKRAAQRQQKMSQNDPRTTAVEPPQKSTRRSYFYIYIYLIYSFFFSFLL